MAYIKRKDLCISIHVTFHQIVPCLNAKFMILQFMIKKNS